MHAKINEYIRKTVMKNLFVFVIFLVLLCMSSNISALEPSSNNYKIAYSKPLYNWFPALFSKYIVKGKISSINYSNQVIKFKLVNSQFLKSDSIDNVVDIKFDYTDWGKNSISHIVNKINELEEGDEIIVFSNRYYAGEYQLYPFDIIESNNFLEQQKIIDHVLKVSSMVSDNRLGVEINLNPNRRGEIVTSMLKINNSKTFEQGVGELVSYGFDSFYIIFNELDDFNKLDKKITNKPKKKKKSFNYKYSPQTYFEVYDSILWEIVGYKPYYGSQLKTNELYFSKVAWKTFIWFVINEKSFNTEIVYPNSNRNSIILQDKSE
jgi:hypothetical protein